MSGHKPIQIALIGVTFAVFVITITLNALSASPAGTEIGVFRNSNVEISDKHYLQITPAGWTFSIWGFIYAWQGLIFVYAFSTVFRKTPDGSFLYLSPLLPPAFFVVYIINQCCNITWLFLFDSQYVGWSLVPIALMPLTLYICIGLSAKRLVDNGDALIKQGFGKDVWFIRLIVHNGLTIYATWTTIATLLNFAMLLIYRFNVDNGTACTASLGILTAEIVIWFTLESTVLDRYVRYMFIQYVTILLALTGSLVENYNPGRMNTMFTVVLMGAAGGLTLAKVIIMGWRSKTTPIFFNRDVNSMSDIRLT